MQAQLDEQRAEFRLDQRPILTLIPIPEGSNAPKSGPVYDKMAYGYNYGVKNIGKGTALGIIMFEYVSILEDGQWFWSTAYSGVPISQDRLDLASRTEASLVVKIIIKYKDVFGTIYTTNICLFNHINGATGGCLPSQFASIPTDGEQYEKMYK